MSNNADVGVIGLAVMGRNLARNFARHGFAVALYNRSEAKTHSLVEEFGHEGTFVGTESLNAFVGALTRPRRLVIMVQAGAPTDAVIEQLTPLLEPGDVIIDGGNAHFADTRRREAALRERDIEFVGAGISGGEEGALNGPSIMPGGTAAAYEKVAPLLTEVSARVEGTPCCTHVGPDGAGHFVKMVHNGIEYADMQLIAEAYDLLRRAGGQDPAALAETFRRWNGGRLASYLIEITAEVLGHTDADTGRPLVDVIADQAGQKGTGRWTVQTALDLGVPVSGIAEAVFARSLSGHAPVRAAARTLPGPTPQALSPKDAARFTEQVEQALYASKVVSYAQGWHMIAAAAEEYGWDIDLGRLATIWRGGCIIRADFLNRIRAAYAADPRLPSLLADEEFAKELGAAQDVWREVIGTAARLGIATPGFCAALAYYDALRSDVLPTALIQAQRDFFGAHTYRRTDREGSFHTRWGGDRSQERIG
ncbi:NADP-dependent phosphogluconate dehydrogenase [Streptomyces sp. LHD-70]|uniref:NADP-dependent phosphogluconate dehydrogenase n=1 Tax=Streptomyces sp. LHD-70 TaxID=3072140 RepID=UPI00280FF295|nr:NADP-dependent phosphogluconate dehydrogenase [Streptomyces sp. LHD-70]MDQ8702549.1 NADP-dependent phosphogluconate dehydrogenase [Streptomyces sp. LHD-70]